MNEKKKEILFFCLKHSPIQMLSSALPSPKAIDGDGNDGQCV